MNRNDSYGRIIKFPCIAFVNKTKLEVTGICIYCNVPAVEGYIFGTKQTFYATMDHIVLESEMTRLEIVLFNLEDEIEKNI